MCVGAVAAIVAALMVAAPASAAEFGIAPGSVEVRTIDAVGDPDLRAGAHPDRLQVDFGLDVEGTGTSARDLALELPPGLALHPAASPNCPRDAFALETCQASTRVGALTLRASGGSQITAPIFKLVPEANQLIALGAGSPWATELEIGQRPSDYGLTLASGDLPPNIEEGMIELWGVAADGPFLTTPPRCGPIGVTLRVRSLEVGAPWLSESAESTPLTGCESLPFAPLLGFEAGNPVADSPTGVVIDVSAPQYDDPDERVGAHIEDASIELPDGFAISPGSLVGKKLCSDLQLGLGTAGPAACDPLSRVGSVELASPSFDEPLTGSVFLGAGTPSERLRLFVAATGRGAAIKFVSSLRSDPVTGQITMGMKGLPQVAWTDMSIDLDGGPGALLATPLICGTSIARAKLDPHTAVAPVEPVASVSIASLFGSQCPGGLPFAPELTAGTGDPAAAGSTSFFMDLRRHDGEQLPARFFVMLPRGLSAAPGSAEVCSEVGTSTGFCPAGSRVGSVSLEVGSGPSPARLRGEAFLTGPYRRASFGLVLTFRAAIGPLDLGRVTLRSAVRVNRLTGQARIESDPLPELVEGIPIRFRGLRIDLDREGFIRNATSCAPRAIDSTVRSNEGASVATASPYAAIGCDKLRFHPSFSIGLGGRSEMHPGGHPDLSISTTVPKRNANLRALSVRMPRSLQFDPGGVDEICTRGDAVNGLCPQGSRVGTSSARTSLLDDPLRGPIYVVQPEGKGFPDLWMNLGGSSIRVDLGGQSSVRHGRFTTKFVDLPDMPLSSLSMKLRGGEDGILSLRNDPCRADRARNLTSRVLARGQNGGHRRKRMLAKLSPGCAAR